MHNFVHECEQLEDFVECNRTLTPSLRRERLTVERMEVRGEEEGRSPRFPAPQNTFSKRLEQLACVTDFVVSLQGYFEVIYCVISALEEYLSFTQAESRIHYTHIEIWPHGEDMRKARRGLSWRYGAVMCLSVIIDKLHFWQDWLFDRKEQNFRIMLYKRSRKAPSRFEDYAVGATYPSTSDTGGEDPPVNLTTGSIKDNIKTISMAMDVFKQNICDGKSNVPETYGDKTDLRVVDDVILVPPEGDGCDQKTGQKRKFENNECVNGDAEGEGDKANAGKGTGGNNGSSENNGPNENNCPSENNGPSENTGIGNNNGASEINGVVKNNGTSKNKSVGVNNFASENNGAGKEDDDEEDEEEEDDRTLKLLGAIWTTLRNFREVFNYRINHLNTQINGRFDALDGRVGGIERQLRMERTSAFPEKPNCLPLKTPVDIEVFETVDDEVYDKVVTFLGKLSSGTVEERVL